MILLSPLLALAVGLHAEGSKTSRPSFLIKDSFDGGGEQLAVLPESDGKQPRLPSASEGAETKNSSDGRVWIEAPASGREERTRIADAGVAIEEIGPGSIEGIADPSALRRLKDEGVSFRLKGTVGGPTPEDFPPADRDFHNYERTKAALAALAAARPDLATAFSMGNSLEGRDLAGLRLTSSKRPEKDLPAVVFFGTHHAREHLSTEVPLLLAKTLIERASEPEIAKLLAERVVYIVPMINPDGVEKDLLGDRYHLWRKNARPNGDGTMGVDLNRNYSYGWGGGGASRNPSSETYRGPAPFSEPETQAVRAFVEGHPNIKILLTYHSFSELILYPWGHTYDPIKDDKDKRVHEIMAKRMAEWNGYTPEQSSQLYIASGDTTDWSYGEKRVFSFTFELTPKSMWDGGFYPGAKVIQSTFEKNLPPALYLIEKAGDPYAVLNEPNRSVVGGPVPPTSAAPAR